MDLTYYIIWSKYYGQANINLHSGWVFPWRCLYTLNVKQVLLRKVHVWHFPHSIIRCVAILIVSRYTVSKMGAMYSALHELTRLFAVVRHCPCADKHIHGYCRRHVRLRRYRHIIPESVRWFCHIESGLLWLFVCGKDDAVCIYKLSCKLQL